MSYDNLMDECYIRAKVYRDSGAVWNLTHEEKCISAISELSKQIEKIKKENFILKWNNIKNKLPENEKDVLVCVKRKYYNSDKYIRFIVKAFYTDGKHNTEDSNYVWDNCNFEYDEKADAYIIPKGWWESVNYIKEFGMIEDLTQAKACDGSFITHWTELPELPMED